MKVLTISYAKRALEEGSREQVRMQTYAGVLDAYVLVVLTRKKDALPEAYSHGNVSILGTNTHTRVGMLIKAFLLSRTVIKKEKNWTISSQDPYESSVVAYLLCLFSKNKLHVQIHSDPFAQQGTIMQKMRTTWMYFVLKKASAIRVVSKRVRDALVQKGVSEASIRVLPIQADLSDFLTVGEKRIYIKGDTTTYVSIGRFVSGKNIDLIVRSFEKVYAENPQSRLVIVGDGPLRPSIETLIHERGLVEAISVQSWRNDVEEVLREADVFVFASDHEGYGLVLLEAAAAGLPIITTDVGCVGWLLHDTKDCVVVAPSQENIVSAMNFFARTETQQQFGRSAFATARKVVLPEQEYLAQWRDAF